MDLEHVKGGEVFSRAWRLGAGLPALRGETVWKQPAVTYSVKEIFYTIQGEGANIGRPAVFIRFAGCNLWSGREEDRARAVCRFCDTDFLGGEKFASARVLADKAASLWPPGQHKRMVVLTGGEPLLQIDRDLLIALKAEWFYIAVETNGTQALPGHVDWLCVSPKAGTPLVLHDADELKLVYPQKGAEPEQFGEFRSVYRWLSPMASQAGNSVARLRITTENAARASAYCLAHPEWRLAIQAHKFWNVP